ncbi:MAG: plastocyanin/azurin family copper-binding protein [Adhaeribacter sp.]
MLKYYQWIYVWLVLLLALPVHAHPVADSVTTVHIKAIAGLQYNMVRFQVKPGARVKLILTNTDDMSHNLVITRPGAREAVVNAALKLGEQGPKLNFVPPLPQVLWSIPVLEPDETKSITFTTPKTTGVYPYVCTYPGHGIIMYGAMYVGEVALPPLANDLNIPPARRTENIAATSAANNNLHAAHPASTAKPAHPYELDAPFLYRVFMPDASPAAIAVSLPQELSYCWDAGTCRLRYAWQGGFLDNSDSWKGKGDSYGIILGQVFYRDKTSYPLRLNQPENIPAVAFKGYQLRERYPEFKYNLNGITVYELIKPKAEGTGLIRTFRILDNSQKIWFVTDSADGVQYEATAGKWIGGKLKLTARQARHFSITMTRKEGVKL